MKNPEKLLDLLAQDARLTPAQLAAMLGESEEDVAAAIKAYEKNSTILGYKTVVDWDHPRERNRVIEVKITRRRHEHPWLRQIYSHHQVGACI
ncbi:MAG: AsnC family transcriptional regulator [Butyricicoccus sp.]